MRAARDPSFCRCGGSNCRLSVVCNPRPHRIAAARRGRQRSASSCSSTGAVLVTVTNGWSSSLTCLFMPLPSPTSLSLIDEEAFLGSGASADLRPKHSRRWTDDEQASTRKRPISGRFPLPARATEARLRSLTSRYPQMRQNRPARWVALRRCPSFRPHDGRRCTQRSLRDQG